MQWHLPFVGLADKKNFCPLSDCLKLNNHNSELQTMTYFHLHEQFQWKSALNCIFAVIVLTKIVGQVAKIPQSEISFR